MTNKPEPLDLEALRKFFNAMPQSNSDRYGLALIAEVERLQIKCENLERQAVQWKGEDAGHKSSLFECYRAVTGGEGEPADWHGSRPVVEYIARLKAALAPFAKEGRRIPAKGQDEVRYEAGCDEDACPIYSLFDVGDLRNAAKAMEGES